MQKSLKNEPTFESNQDKNGSASNKMVLNLQKSIISTNSKTILFGLTFYQHLRWVSLISLIKKSRIYVKKAPQNRPRSQGCQALYGCSLTIVHMLQLLKEMEQKFFALQLLEIC